MVRARPTSSGVLWRLALTGSCSRCHALAVDGTFASPEEAALSAWSHTPGADARALDVQLQGEDQALVVIEVEGNPGYNRDLVTCSRDAEGRWTWTGSSGASTP